MDEYKPMPPKARYSVVCVPTERYKELEAAEARAAELQAEVERLQKIANREPFYWTRPERFPADQCADEGWYVWTDRGLVYLGTMADNTMLDDPEDID